MTTIVGAVDATTVQIEGVLSLTSTRFDASTTGGTSPDEVAAVALFLAVATTDGTNTSWDVLAPDAAAEADGLVPAGWASTVHLDMGGADFIALAAPDADPDTVFTVLVPAGDAVGVWQFTPATIEAPWTQVDVSLAYCTAPKWFGAATDAGAWVTLADPDGAAAALAAEATAREDADSALTSDVAGKASAAALTAEADARAAGDASNALDLARTQRSIGATVVDRRPKLRLHTAVNGSGHEGGAYSTPQLGDLTGGFWLRFTATVEPYLTPPADPEDPPVLYSEIITLPHDLVGSWDNLEPAFERMWDNDSGRWRTYLFCEWTEIGGTIEAQQVTTLRSYITAGVHYPKREILEGVDQEWAIWLDFANGDGVWEYKLLRRIYDGTPDETVDGAEWELFLHVLGDAPTSIDTGVTAYPWRIGCGPGKVRYGEIVFRNGGPDGADLFTPSGAEAVAAGEGQPFTDGTGIVWTPDGGEAEVYDPTATGGGVSLGETSTTAYRGDRGKAAYDHSQVATGNPHGTTAADVGAQPVDSDLTAIAALSTTSYGRAFLALADAAAGRTALGLGTAALSATGDFATAAHTHTGTYQPLDSDLTSIAALTTTPFGRALLELADAAAARTALGTAYGTATGTVAEGISIASATWRTGNYYGAAIPISNAGNAMASGTVRAVPFFNPVAGRTIDQLAIDVFSASGTPAAILYICTDSNGYPGTVVASGSVTPAATSRQTASVSYTLPRGLLWLVAHSTAATWAGLALFGPTPYLPVNPTYSANPMSCWQVTGAGTSTLTSFPAGGTQSANGMQILLRAA